MRSGCRDMFLAVPNPLSFELKESFVVVLFWFGLFWFFFAMACVMSARGC